MDISNIIIICIWVFITTITLLDKKCPKWVKFNMATASITIILSRLHIMKLGEKLAEFVSK